MVQKKKKKKYPTRKEGEKPRDHKKKKV